MKSFTSRQPTQHILNGNTQTLRRRSKTRVAVISMARETDPKKRVVITGMGLCSVFGNNYDNYYAKLLAGESGVAPIDRFDTSDFPTKFAAQIRDFDSEGYIDKKNDRRLDDCLRYALVSGNKALEDAGLDSAAIETLDKQRVGVLVGLSLIHI